MTERGGLLYRCGEAPGTLGFLPLEVVRAVTSLSAVTPVARAKPPLVGVALADGKVVTVLDVGADAASSHAASPLGLAVLCELDGHTLALVGGEIVATGLFQGRGEDAVDWRGERAETLDLRAIYASAEAAAWADRALMEDR